LHRCRCDAVGVCLTPDETGTTHITQDNLGNADALQSLTMNGALIGVAFQF
jgi:hypothetical protein